MWILIDILNGFDMLKSKFKITRKKGCFCNWYLILGGYGLEGKTSTTEFVYENGTSAIGPNLPVPVDYHCMVKLSETMIMIIGGRSELGGASTSYGANTYTYDTETQEFTTGPSLIYGR